MTPDRDPREYGWRAPDGTGRIHVPWSGWRRNDAHPFLTREADPMAPTIPASSET